MFTMSATWRGPSPAARSRWDSAACAQYSRPSTLSSTICCHSDSGAPAAGPSSITPGVVDEHVETTQLGDRARNSVCRLLLVCDVGLQHDHERRHRQRQRQCEPRTRPACRGLGLAVTQSAPFRLVSASSPLAGRLGPDYLDMARTWRDLS